MNLRLSLACLLLAVPLFGADATMPSSTATVVVLPFDNVSGVEAAPEIVRAALERELPPRGWQVVDDATVEPVLEQERVRYLDSLPPAVRARVVAATGASAILSGSIYSYSEGANAVVSVSARMVRPDGSLIWMDLAGIAANDTEGAFGFGRKSSAGELALSAVQNLLQRLPRPGEAAPLPEARTAGLFRRAGSTYRASELDTAVPNRICILPFENLSGNGDAARVVAEVLALRLAAADGFEVVDPAEMREAALRAHVGSFRNATNEALARLGSAVGTTLFLKGTLYEFHDNGGRQGDVPRIQLEFRIVDVSAGKVLWAAQHERTGADYTGLLLRGEVTSAAVLADRMVAEMIHTEGQPAPRAARAITAARAARRKGPEARTELQTPRKGEKAQ
jgi:TolB-like protein